MDVIKQYGADVLRCYIMFISDYEMQTPWNSDSIKGCARFLDKVESLNEKVRKGDLEYSKKLKVLINQTIKGVSSDIEASKFNTAISKLMILTNSFLEQESISQLDYEVLLKLLNPYCPHMVEELWHNYHDNTIQYEKYPTYNETDLLENTCTIVISVNGKVRDKIEAERGMSDDDLKSLVLNREKIKPYVEGGIKKIIIIKDKIVNIVA